MADRRATVRLLGVKTRSAKSCGQSPSYRENMGVVGGERTRRDAGRISRCKIRKWWRGRGWKRKGRAGERSQVGIKQVNSNVN